ncbi:MAG TPA: ArsR family transcriptional regulator [Rhizobiales bacterium]|nr:ArsR family transcriptional regulator [Hyphomicrobiales bacterium]
MSYMTIVQEDRRLVILRALAEDADYSHNEYVLRSFLDAYGHKIGLDQMRTELAWLSEQGLITIRDGSGVMVAKLTGRGKDVAEGAVVVPGVKRPEPGM